MRLAVKEFLAYARDHYTMAEPILDVCAGWEPNYYEPLFPGKTYLKQDQVQFAPPNIDYVCDAHSMTPIDDHSVGSVLLMEALEHLQEPQKVVDQIFRILRPGGYCLATTVMTFEIHRTPYDYWRFCPDGICYLFRAFQVLELVLEHHRVMPMGIWAVCRKPEEGAAASGWETDPMPLVRVHESGESTLKNFIKRVLKSLGLDIRRLPKDSETFQVIGKRETDTWKGSLR